MAILNVVYVNHMDLTWRRPRYSADDAKEGVKIAPYGEIQELQIDAGLDFIHEGGCYSLEQTLSLREYIERNPDRKDEIKELISKGRLEIMGGGESGIDYNMPDGEALVRNHMYSRRWLKEEFDYTPRLASCPDTFGLSANLPALFRDLGYKGLSQYHRVFQKPKAVWKGISGDRVALETANWWPFIYYGGANKARVCGICGGVGCVACEGLGHTVEYFPKDEASFESLAERIKARAGEGDLTVFLTGEETLPKKGSCTRIKEVAKELGYEARFMGYEEYMADKNAELLENIDTANEDMIDPRSEGNPVCSGIYSSRIKIKVEVRLCEAYLRAAERMAVMASLEGEKYPVKTFELLWRQLAYLNFHDSIPASHSDGAYDELMETGRRLRFSAGKIIKRCGRVLAEKISADAENGIPFAVINPLEFPVENAVLTASLPLDKKVKGGVVVAPDGTRHTAFSLKHTSMPESKDTRFCFFGDLPAFGYGVFRFIPSYEDNFTFVENDSLVMENEYFRIEFDDCGIRCVIDKKSGRLIAEEGTFSPVLSDDAGNPWARVNRPLYFERADKPTYFDNMLPPGELFTKVSYCRCGDVQFAKLEVLYARVEQQINSLKWTALVMLVDGSDEIKVEIDTSFDAENAKLYTQISLPVKPTGGMIDYEIPLGRVSRGKVLEADKTLGYSDEWPSLRFVSANLGYTRLTLANSGTPGHAVEGNTLRVSLMRRPTLSTGSYGIKGALDPSFHHFEFTLSAGKSDMEEYRSGMKLNTFYPAFVLEAQNGKESPLCESFIKLPSDAILLALKGAEDGDGFICRYLGGKEKSRLSFESPATVSSVLEEKTEKKLRQVEISPFSITTLRVGEEELKKK